MTDILKRIDWLYVAEIEAASPDPDMVQTYADAKTEIERLRAGNDRLRAALREIATGEVDLGGNCRVRWDSIEIARRALKGKDFDTQES